MAAYITSGLNAKMLASPNFVQPQTEEYLSIMDEIDILYIKYDALRSNVPFLGYRYGEGNEIKALRSLRKQIVVLEIKAKRIEDEHNKHWNKYWGINEA